MQLRDLPVCPINLMILLFETLEPLQLPEQFLPSKLEEQLQDPLWLSCWQQRHLLRLVVDLEAATQTSQQRLESMRIQSQRLDIDVCQSIKTGIRKQAPRSLLTVH